MQSLYGIECSLRLSVSRSPHVVRLVTGRTVGRGGSVGCVGLAGGHLCEAEQDCKLPLIRCTAEGIETKILETLWLKTQRGWHVC